MLWFGILTRSICCMGRCFSLHLQVLRIFCMGMQRKTRLCLVMNTCWRLIKTKTVGVCKLRIENTYGRKQNKALSDILSPHIPYKNLEYEQKEKI